MNWKIGLTVASVGVVAFATPAAAGGDNPATLLNPNGESTWCFGWAQYDTGRTGFWCADSGWARGRVVVRHADGSVAITGYRPILKEGDYRGPDCETGEKVIFKVFKDDDRGRAAVVCPD
jgi:hypothetical protein